MKNYYQILGVKPTATEAEIKQSYRVLAKKYHPDVNPGDSEAASKFADINEAHGVLSDPTSRAEYDAKLKEANTPRPGPEEVIARQRAQAQAAARQAAFRNMAMNGMSGNARREATMAAARQAAQAAHAQTQAQIQVLCNQAFQKGREQGASEARQAAQAEITKLKASLQSALNENKKIKILEKSEAELKSSLAAAEEDRRELEQELFNRDREFAQSKNRIKELEDTIEQMGDGGNAATRARVESSELQELLDRAQNDLRELRRDYDELQRDKEKLQADYAELEQRCKHLEQENKQSELKNSAQIQLQQDKRHVLQDEIDGLNKRIAELTEELDAARAENEQWQQYAQSEDFLSDTEKRIEAWTKKVNADKRKAKSTLYGDLGVLIWATDEQIKEAYAKLVKRLKAKTDDSSVAKLQKAAEAFEILSDPIKRAEYNATIDITDERIESERKLIAENEAIMEEYRSQLANKEFWMHFDDLTAAAMSGDAAAQYELGEMYYTGEDIDGDLEQAVFWFKEAAKQKHADAMYRLGVCYVNGEGIEKNEQTGQGFIRQAAKLGSGAAQEAVGKK